MLATAAAEKVANLQQLKPSKVYRPDIDGLRALAVSLVVLFHITTRFCPGGFVGVDVFFVISGYLITGIISHDILRDRFSFASFYEHRIRRIFPALVVMLVVSSLASVAVFLPYDLINYAKSLLAALFSSSNFYFWAQSDYFDSTFVKVLLHTWSLSVEEQFYLLLPVGLVLLYRRPHYFKPALLLVFATSFATSQWLTVTQPTSAFFMPWSRAWELLAGALLTLNIVKLPNSKVFREIAAAAGLAMIALSAFCYSSATPFPGVAALLPVSGAALVLGAGQNSSTVSASLLSLKPVRFLGLISYSVYLWHWPLLIFTHIGALPGLRASGVSGNGLLIILSVLFGYLSWRFVEQPFRKGQWTSLPESTLFALAGGCAGVLSTSALLLILGGGFPARYPVPAINIDKYVRIQHSHKDMRLGTCFITSKYKFSDYKPEICLSSKPDSANTLLIGDSHAAMYWQGLQDLIPKANVMQATSSGCKPLTDAYDSSACGEMRNFIFNTWLPTHRPTRAIVVERWKTPGDVQGIQATLSKFHTMGIPTTVIGPAPEYDAPLPMLLCLSLKFRSPWLPQAHLLTDLQSVDTLLCSKSPVWNFSYLSPWRLLCRGSKCDTLSEQTQQLPILLDDNHLSPEKAEDLVREWTSSGQL